MKSCPASSVTRYSRPKRLASAIDNRSTSAPTSCATGSRSVTLRDVNVGSAVCHSKPVIDPNRSLASNFDAKLVVYDRLIKWLCVSMSFE